MRRTKFLSLLIAITFLLSAVTPAFAAVPEDVIGDDAESAVGKLIAAGIVEGYEDGTIRPEGTITRAEFAKIAVVAMGLEAAADAVVGTTDYNDTVAGAWYTGYINIATTNDLIQGYPDGTFKPNDPISNNEAVTILVRMLGLGPVVEKTGTWPANYIGRAANLGVLKDVNPVGTANATRGDVFRMLDNSIDIPMWGAVGYNSDGSVQYGLLGEDKTDRQTLLGDKLEIAEHKVEVTGYDLGKSELTVAKIAGKGVAGTYEVTWDGSLYEAYLNDVVIWLNSDDEIVFFEVDSDYHLDAVEFAEADNEVKLISADTTLDAAGSNTSNVVYKEGTTKYDYAKVVLNDDGEVERIEKRNWDEFFVVEDIDETVVEGYGNDVNLKDYDVVKEGKEITISDIEKGDIVFINGSDEFAEVYNNVAAEGDIDKVFINAFRVDGKDFDYAPTRVYADAQYLDGEDLKDLDQDAANDLKDGGEVAVYVDRHGDAVYADGKLGNGGSSTFLAYVRSAENFTDRGVFKRTLDVFTEKGINVDYNVSEKVYNSVPNSVYWAADDIVEVEIDSEGDVEKVTTYKGAGPSSASISEIKTTDKYVGGNKINSDTVVFLTTDYIAGTPSDKDDLKVKLFGELNFDSITSGEYAYDTTSNVVAIDAQTTSSTGDSDYWAVAVGNSREDSDGKQFVDLIVDDWDAKEYVIDGVVPTGAIKKGTFLYVSLEDGTNKITTANTVYHATRNNTSKAPDTASAYESVYNNGALGNEVYGLNAKVSAAVYVKEDSISLSDEQFKLTSDSTVDNGKKTKSLVSDAVILDSDYNVVSLRDLDDAKAGNTNYAEKHFRWLEEAPGFVKYLIQLP